MAKRGVRGVAASVIVAVLFCLFAEEGFSAENSSRLRFRFGGEYAVPILGDESLYNSGYLGTASLEYSIFSLLSPIARVAMSSLSLKNLSPISVYEGDFGLSSRFDFSERFFARAELSGGFFRATWGDKAANGLAANARAGIGFRLSPSFRLAGDVGVSRFFQGSASLFTGISAGLNVSVFPEGFDPMVTKLKVNSMDLFPVFPVFYSYYDDHPFGYVQIQNGEDVLIRDVRVSFYAPDYMSKPTECIVFDTVSKGDIVRIPLTAIFNEKMLQLTERTKTRGDLIVEYHMLGSKREFKQDIDLTVYHRNAMTWSDDRHAAAFVSSKDPAVLWFSRFVNAVVRDRFRTGIDKNLQQAIGIFEAMKLFGLAYVVDPTSSYADNANSDDVVDYLQFPHQTLFYRGGDCDDLSILFTSLLQSVGIETAFITIPGHIYMAFATELTEETARRDFYDPDLLIYKNGKVWVPVEITMVKDGFVKAWRVGAKEWTDNARIEKANFYPMADSWKIYPPVSVPDVNPRFQLPDEALTMKAFDLALDRHVAREIEPKVKALKSQLAVNPSPETENMIGLVYARQGMLTEAWNYFSSAAQKGYLPAWTNLANVAYIRKDYNLSRDYYRYALEKAGFEPIAVLGIARSEYELERFRDAEVSYAELKQLDAALAKRYSYLSSMYGGTGRAWSLAERAETVEWVDKVRTRPAPAAVASAASAPQERVSPTSENVPSAAAPIAKLESPLSPAKPTAAKVKPEPPKVAPSIADVAPDDLDLKEREIESARVKKEQVVPEPAHVAVPLAPKLPTETQAQKTSNNQTPKVAPVVAAVPVDADLKEKETESARVKKEQVVPEPAPVAVALAPKLPAETQAQKTSNNQTPKVAPVVAAVPVDADLKEKETESARVKREQAVAEPVLEAAPAVVALAPRTPVETQKPLEPRQEQKSSAEVKAPKVETENAAAVSMPALKSVESIEEKTARTPIPAIGPSAQPITPDERDFSQALSRAVPERKRSVALVEGFADFKIGPGSWTLKGNKAVQTDPLQMFAKIAASLSASQSAMRISFDAKATGYMWTGFGVHFLCAGVKTLKGYGAGTSYLVWFTSDARNFPDNSERVQVYRSIGDSDMLLVLDKPLSCSIRDKHSYVIESDPANKDIRVLIDGEECIRALMAKYVLSGPSVVIRALDTAEFYDFRVESIK